MPLARASSAIEARLPSICSGVSGPVLPAMSLVPARITTTFGFSSITSCRNRTSICGVVCPLIPRFTYGLLGNDTSRCQPSVIESPINTTRFSPGFGAPSVTFSSLNRSVHAKSDSIWWSCLRQ